MQLTIEIEVQDCDGSDISVTNQCENLTLEIIDAPVSDGVSIDDAAGIGDTDVTWSADKSASKLDAKVDKVAGKSLVSNTEIAKLATVQENATANRDDSLNADKVHEHVIADVAELAAKLELINQWLQVPADKKYFDFIGNRYSENGAPAPLSSFGSTFTRLSAATQWKDGVLVDVSANVMRLDKTKGLLLEKSSTELITNNSTLTSTNAEWVATQKTDAQLGNVFEFVSDGTAARILTNIPAYPNGNITPASGLYYRALLVKKSTGFLAIGAAAGATIIVVNTSTGEVLTTGTSVINVKVSVYDNYLKIELSSSDSPPSANNRSFFIFSSDQRGVAANLGVPSSGYKVTIAFPSLRDTVDFPQSVIKTTGVQSTRAKETLVIPFTAGQTVTSDKDEGVTMAIVDNNAVFEGQGYIRSIRVN